MSCCSRIASTFHVPTAILSRYDMLVFAHEISPFSWILTKTVRGLSQDTL
nr:MAG TPA: hypothetical protein [Caudoviricetes sp.]